MALRLRSCVLLAVGALGLHQLRYTLAYGGRADRALHAQGHAYLGPVTAAAVAALILALAVGLHRVAAGDRAEGAGRRLGRLWPVASGALLAIYAAQESVEGALAPGHPGGLAALVGHGGWIAAPLAAALGLLIALALRGAREAEETLAGMARVLSRSARALRPPLVFSLPAAPPPRVLPVLAASAAGRAPPRAS
jgi:hypothetical protein